MRTLPIVGVIILGCGVSCSSVAQAAAEGAMVHANSAAATTKVGSALGNALSHGMSGTAENMESLSPKVGHRQRGAIIRSVSNHFHSWDKQTVHCSRASTTSSKHFVWQVEHQS
jgi:hypothetical protein